MTPVEILRAATQRRFTDHDGQPSPIELLPPATPEALRRLESAIPCPLPGDVRELLAYSRGFLGGAVDVVDFTGEGLDVELEGAFPNPLGIAHDGFGNYWVADLHANSTAWAPIYFMCHDAPVILFQAQSLEEFLAELFRLYTPPFSSTIDDVHEDRLFSVWRKNPGVMSRRECMNGNDTELQEFAATLSEAFSVVDLRQAKVGMGFSWGRFGPKTELRRHGALPIFAYAAPKREQSVGFVRRLLGGSA